MSSALGYLFYVNTGCFLFGRKLDIMKIILHYIKKHWKLALITILLSFVDVVAALLIPTYTAKMLNISSLAIPNASLLKLTLLKMIIASFISVISTIIGTYLCAILTSKIGSDMRRDLYKASLSLSVLDFKDFGIASITTRTVSDITNIQFALAGCFQMLFPVPVIFVVSLVLSFRIDKLLGIILLLVILAISIIGIIIMKSSLPIFKRLQKKLDKMSNVLLENITGVRVIRAFNKEQYEEKRLKNEFEEYAYTSIKVNKRFAILDGISFFAVNMFVIIVYYLSGYRITKGYFEIGDITAVIEYAMMCLFFLMMAQMIILTLPRAVECSNRIGEVISYKPSILDNVSKDIFEEKIDNVLAFENVSFSYGDSKECVLSNLNFVCKRGQTTAIIGGTGSGKSTIASIIMRFNEVSNGRILLNGIDICNMPQKQLRNHLSFVQQRAWLFSGTIAENLRFGNQQATDEELWEVLNIAQAKDFVERLPNKLNSYVSQGGTNFSGGQRQRLSIARALVKKPELYIFDDSFSALDFKTDSLLRKALKSVTKGAAVIIIAQRISTITTADNIIVLDEGKIVGSGKHIDLLNDCSVYREIYESQTKEVNENE